MMKRALILVCVTMLALCPMLTARAESPEDEYILPEYTQPDYTLPEEMKKVPASAAEVALPAELPEPAVITDFSISPSGLITVKLDRVVPKLVIKEINFVDAVENTIYSKTETDTAEAHRTGDDSSIFSVRILWAKKNGFEQEYNTWGGTLGFVSARITAENGTEYEFRENGSLSSETRTVPTEGGEIVRTAIYAENGQAESCLACWRSLDGSYLLDIETTPDGALTSIEYRTDMDAFMLRSEPMTAYEHNKLLLRENSYSSAGYDLQIITRYPEVAAAVMPYSTQTDLLPVNEELLGQLDKARIWVISFGDYVEYEEFVYISVDPLFLVKDGKAVPNRQAKDINGDPIDFGKMPELKLPAFDAPEF